MKHLKIILNILRSMLKPGYTTWLCRETGKILYHEKEMK